MNKTPLILLILFIFIDVCWALRINRPPKISFPVKEEEINQLNRFLEDSWNIQNGRNELDNVSTAKSAAKNGESWILDTSITSKLQFKSDGSVFTVCNEGGTCSGSSSLSQEFCYTLESPTTSDTNIPIFSPANNIRMTSIYCRVQGGTSATMHISDGTNDSDNIVCSTSGQADDGSLANATFNANERMEMDVTAVSGSVTWLNVCVRYVNS